MSTVITEAQRFAGAAAIDDLLTMLGINPQERGETGLNGEPTGDTIAEAIAGAVLKAAHSPELALTAPTYTHPGRIPVFTVSVGNRARDLRSGKEGLVLEIRRETRFAPWKVAMKLDDDGSTWLFFAHQIVAPKGQ